jgi:hypothetical protein
MGSEQKGVVRQYPPLTRKSRQKSIDEGRPSKRGDGDDQREVEPGLLLYREYNNNLRTWLLAFGIGGPVAILTNDRVLSRIAAAGEGESIFALFVVGVLSQILIAAINKYSNWLSCYAEGSWCSIADWINGQIWIDFVLDVLAIGAFALASLKMFWILTLPDTASSLPGV